MSETASEPEGELPAPLEVLLACSEEDECAVLNKILTDGHDQGWVLSDCDAEVLVLSPAHADALFARAAKRAPIRPTATDVWADTIPSAQSVPEQPVSWAVLTQRCDLVRNYAVEPVVEIARVVRLDKDMTAAAKTNSPRLIYLADAGDGGVWAVDLRQRAVITKHALSSIAARPVITSERARKRFRLRLGQRYWRDPIPDDLVEVLQRPLIETVRRSSERIARFENFAMWLGLRAENGKIIVIAVAAEGRVAEAREDWEQVIQMLSARTATAAALVESSDSGVYTADDISLGVWLDSFKFDFDEITYGSRAREANAEPPM